MSNLSDFLGGGKPKLITLLTSGTGTYVPTADQARCLVRVQGAGGGSHSAASNYGGAGGQMVQRFIRIPIAGMAYVIGAGGATATVGANSRFGSILAEGGTSAGFTSYDPWTNSGTSATIVYNPGGGYGNSSSDSVAGGAGGMSGYPARAAGFGARHGAPYSLSSGGALYGGGDSFFGLGGVHGGAGPTGYGAGGAYPNTTGGGGCIEIWDFGV